MTLNIGPQHPATHGTLRIIVRLDGEQVVWAEPSCGYMHRGYEKLTEVRTYPQVDDAGQPHRLARQLRQRGAVHPRRREADGDRGAAAGPVDPHAAVRAVAHRQHHAVPRRPRRAARRRHAGVLRLPRPRARAQPHRGRDRRALPPQLRPHRRPQGRPAQGLHRRVPSRDEEDPGLLRRDRGPPHRRRDLPGPHPRRRRHPPRGGAAVRPVRRQPAGQRRRLGPAPRPGPADGLGQASTGRSGPTPTATASPAAGSACRRPASPRRSSTS